MTKLDHSKPGKLSLSQPLMFFVPVIAFIAILIVAFGDIDVSQTTRWVAQTGSSFVVSGLLLVMFADDNKGAETK